MEKEFINVLAYYINKIDRKEITVKEFKNIFDSCFENSMEGIIHPYGREEFKEKFYKGGL